jgi:hypothetical protein
MPEDKDLRPQPRDPASHLPFVCELEPHDPNVEVLPKQFIGSDQQTYAGTKVY